MDKETEITKQDKNLFSWLLLPRLDLIFFYALLDVQVDEYNFLVSSVIDMYLSYINTRRWFT